jgi:dihydroneopterin aldolase
MKQDSLFVRGIQQKFRIGCTADERAWPQLLSVDIKIVFDMKQSFTSDELSTTIDYVAMISLVESLALENEWKLVEKLSYDIGQSILTRWSLVSMVTVSVAKRISEKCTDIVCEVTSLRGQ